MKTLLFMCAILASISTCADAANYPWCARYAKDAGGESCGFITFEQCLADVSGVGGYCALNTQYVPPPGPHSHPWHRRLNR
jgi:hypothetical protein